MENQISKNLQQILSDPRVTAVQDIFNRQDANAVKAQKYFKRYSVVFIIATALATLSAALILFGSGGSGENANAITNALSLPPVRHTLFIVEIVALAAAAFSSHIQDTRRHNTKWDSERRRAEQQRIKLYDTILAVSADSDQKLNGFDYFITNQLDGQLSYFASSESRHDRRSGGFAITGGVIAAVVAITGAGGVSETWLPLIALIGVMAPIILTSVNSWRNSSNDQDKSERYGAIWAELRVLKGDTGHVREKIASGDTEAMFTFASQVHDILRSENKEWTSNKQQ